MGSLTDKWVELNYWSFKPKSLEKTMVSEAKKIEAAPSKKETNTLVVDPWAELFTWNDDMTNIAEAEAWIAAIEKYEQENTAKSQVVKDMRLVEKVPENAVSTDHVEEMLIKVEEQAVLSEEYNSFMNHSINEGRPLFLSSVRAMSLDPVKEFMVRPQQYATISKQYNSNYENVSIIDRPLQLPSIIALSDHPVKEIVVKPREHAVISKIYNSHMNKVTMVNKRTIQLAPLIELSDNPIIEFLVKPKEHAVINQVGNCYLGRVTTNNHPLQLPSIIITSTADSSIELDQKEIDTYKRKVKSVAEELDFHPNSDIASGRDVNNRKIDMEPVLSVTPVIAHTPSAAGDMAVVQKHEVAEIVNEESNKAGKPIKKKRHNILRRFFSALRKKFSRKSKSN